MHGVRALTNNLITGKKTGENVKKRLNNKTFA